MNKLIVVFLLFFVSVFSALAIPRAEYPRPQFERKDWINLNGVKS